MKALVAMTVAALALAGCNSGRTAPQLEKAWVRLAAVPGRPAAAYFVFDAGGLRQEITRVSADRTGRAEMHETMAQGMMSTMTPLTKLDVPAGGSVTFAPGGRHVMLFDVDPKIKPGDQMTLDVGDATAHARVVGAGDPAPY